MTCDFLVIGSGVAGLSFAIKAAEHGSVTVLTKNRALNSNTAWAQGGISAVLPEALRDEGDSAERHLADTLDAGAGLCKEEAVRAIVGEGAETIEELVAWGTDFDKDGERFELGKEGGHSKRRVLHAKDTTGHEIARALLETARRTPNLTLLENHFAIDLITTGRLGVVTDDRVLGAYVLEEETGEVVVMHSDRIILATGGCGKVYLYTTNPDSSTGDGVAMAWRAGASIANMEFVQFHPTCFYNPAATGPEARSFLVSEAVRGEGATPPEPGRRGVSPATTTGAAPSLRATSWPAPSTARSRKPARPASISTSPTSPRASWRNASRTSTIRSSPSDTTPNQDPIPVVPAAHYQCGGVVTDLHGNTTIRGTLRHRGSGLHGPARCQPPRLQQFPRGQRHGPARPRARSCALYPPSRSAPPAPDIPEWEHGDVTPPDELVIIYHNWDEIRRTMWDYVSIVRTDKRLRRAAYRLRNLKKEVREFYWGHRVNSDILELRNLVAVASLIVDCAILRKESRGIHYTLDYPETDPKYQQDTVLRRF